MNEKDESEFIAKEIKRCVANMGGVLKWGDFAILCTPIPDRIYMILHLICFDQVRFNALSRAIESALQKQSIPCRILGGHKFFERMEVREVLQLLFFVIYPLHRSKTSWHTCNLLTTLNSILRLFEPSKFPLGERAIRSVTSLRQRIR